MGLASAWNDFSGRAVLVTGGTKGIGLATALAFGQRGAEVTITHRWGSADLAAVQEAFRTVGAAAPAVVDADAAQAEDVRAVLSGIRERHGRIHALVSNVAFAPLIRSFEDYTRRGLAAAIDYSAWPIVAHTQASREIFGAYPKYVIGLSSEGGVGYHINYDMIAAAKAALETLCRYMHHRLRGHDCRVNVVRTRFVRTESLRATAGDGFEPFAAARSPGLFTPAEEVARAIVGLCSGLMDGVGGQIVTVDRGAGLFDSLGRLYAEQAPDALESAATG